MPSNEQPKTLSDYTPSEWKRGKVIKSTNLNNIENQIDILTDQVLNIGNRLVEFVGANSTTDGNKGVVPAPRAGDENKYLKGDGSWETPAIKYNINDSSIIEGNGTFDMNGNITAQTFSGSGENLTNISGTEVSLATSSAAGAMSSADKIKLDELPTNTQLQTNYVSKSSVSDASGIPNADTTQYGLVKIGSNINVDNGTISVPLATSSVSGIVSAGDGLSIDNGIISNNLNIKNGTGDYSIVEGTITGTDLNTASGIASHAEGYNTIASANCSHAEGSTTTASGIASHAEGYSTIASGVQSHAEGSVTRASGNYSHAEGSITQASGYYSHAEGKGTVAKHEAQHVFGEYNIGDPSTAETSNRGTYIEIVGKGTQTSPANARTLDWNGNEWLAGYIIANNFYKINESIPIGMTSLWSQNATTLGEVTFTLDLTFDYRNYNLLVVKFLLSTAAPGYKYEVVIPDSNAGKQTIIYLNACPNENALYSRNLYLYSSTVNNIKTYKLFVEDGYQRSFLDNTHLSNSLVCVPMEIYGIKL